MSYHTAYRSSIQQVQASIPQPDHVKRKLRDAGRKASYHANRLGIDITDVIGKHNHVLPQSSSAHVNDVVERNYDAAKEAAHAHGETGLGKALAEMVRQYDRWKRTSEYRTAG